MVSLSHPYPHTLLGGSPTRKEDPCAGGTEARPHRETGRVRKAVHSSVLPCSAPRGGHPPSPPTAHPGAVTYPPRPHDSSGRAFWPLSPKDTLPGPRPCLPGLQPPAPSPQPLPLRFGTRPPCFRPGLRPRPRRLRSYPGTSAASSGSGLSSASSSPGGNQDPDFRFRAPAASGEPVLLP